MIILVTGVPGSGKTASAVDMLLDMAGTRPIYADGVPELQIPHEPCPPVNEWTHEADDPASATGKKISFTFPPNSIVVIDECQRVFRPRNSSARVPPEVAAFETHRHLGIDFILITQHPTLVDSNIRRLVGKHIHVRVTALGRYRYEWAECGDPDNRTSREIAQCNRFKLPKRAFNQYKSAELHTKHKFKIPKAVYILALCAVSLGGCIWYINKTIQSKLKPESENLKQLTAPAGAPSSLPVPVKRDESGRVVLTSAEYVQSYQPRIDGLPHSAPAYDEISKPVQVPEPVGCMKSKRTGCKCYTQQGTHYETTVSICEQIFASGLWMPWKPAEPPRKEPEKPVQIAQKQDYSPALLIGDGKPATPPVQVPVPAGGGPSTNPRFNPELRSQ